MRPPTAGAKAAAASSAKGGSQIPLPLRRSPGKSDKAQEGDSVCGEDNEFSKDRSRCSRGDRRHGNEEKSSGGGKMSLLSGTSFCCASGQKEEIRDSQAMRPPQNRRTKNVASVKRDSEMNGPELPNSTPPPLHQASPKKIVTPKSRKVKPEKDSVDDHSAKDEELQGCKPRIFTKEEKTPSRFLSNPPHPNNRLKPSEISDKRKLSSAQPTKGMEDTCSPISLKEKDGGNDPEITVAGKQKCADMLRKLRKDPAPCSTNNILILNVDNKLYEKGLRNSERDSDTLSSGKAAENMPDDVQDSWLNTSLTDEGLPAVVTGFACSVDIDSHDTSLKSPDVDELDCPCCESDPKGTTFPSTGKSYVDCLQKLNTESSFSPLLVDCEASSHGRHSGLESASTQEEKGDLEYQIIALKEELERERLKLQSQQGHVSQLEKEMEVMEQLKQELSKEQELRRDAEEKLREILDRGKHLESGQQRPASDSLPVSASVNKDHSSDRTPENVCKSVEANSPLLLGYESRIRRYQSYISKLERDNLMLIEELKRFKDLSPCSQKDHAKSLLVKLGQLERDSQQQQAQYECCLDEVANKLVHTLLNQKRLEEECQALQTRVQNLEMENLVLSEAAGRNKESKDADSGKCSVSFDPSSNSNSTSSGYSLSECATAKSPSHSKLNPPSSHCNFQKTRSNERFEYSCVQSTRTCKVQPTRQDGSEILSDKNASFVSKVSSASKVPSFNKPSPSAPLRTQANHHLHTRPSTVENDELPNQQQYESRLHESGKLCIANPPDDSPTKSALSRPGIVPPSVTHYGLNAKPSFCLDQTKLSSSKRKRFTKMGTSSERIFKEVRLKNSQHVQWDSLVKGPVNPAFQKNRLFPTRPKNRCDTDKPSGKMSLTSNDVWNVSCPLSKSHKDSLLHDSMSFLCSASQRTLESCAEISRDKTYSSFTDADASASNDGTHRTRDEGYSTMSSDLQPDSAADTTVSEQDDHSATYLASENGLRCSDDSVTECLDGSMSSSSDSGFGPLHYMTRNPARKRLLNSTADNEDSCDSHKESDCSPSNDHVFLDSLGPSRQVTEGQQTEGETRLLKNSSEKPDSCMEITFSENHDPSTKSPNNHALRMYNNTNCRDLCSGGKSLTSTSDSENYVDSISHIALPPAIADEENMYLVQLLKSKNIGTFEFLGDSARANNLSSRMKHAIPKDAWTRTEGDDLSSYLQESMERSQCSQDEIVVETAEKATLTEPEEGIWREKALAHFIDESIWSLYSSESDAQSRQFPENFLSQNSTEELSREVCLIPRSETNPCVILCGDLSSEQSYTCGVNDKGASSESDNNSLLQASRENYALKNVVGSGGSKAYFSPHGLERVASDTVLYLKDAFRELETSMKPGLKSAKNITNQNIPLFDRISSACLNDLESLPSPDSDPNQREKSEFPQRIPQFSRNTSLWLGATNHSHSSSMSSLQSSVSYHRVSDEIDDEEGQPASRKGSQDPDLSSDADNENFEHQDFVERWLQNEIVENSFMENKVPKVRLQSVRSMSTSARKGYLQRSNEAPVNIACDSSHLQATLLSGREMESSFSKQSSLECDQSSLSVLPRLPMTPDSPESCYMGAVSAFYIDACDNYSHGKSSCAQLNTSPEHMSSPSSIVYPLVFTCENLDDETMSLCDHFDSNEIVHTVEFEEGLSKSLEPEVKEFNSDFYRLCSVGSLRSLDSFTFPSQEMFLKKYSGSPKGGMRACSRSSIEQLQRSPTNSQKTISRGECSSKPRTCHQPVRPTSFASPLTCSSRQFSCFGKDLEVAKLPEKISQNMFLSVYNGEANASCHIEKQSKCSPRFDDSLPLNRTYILKRQVSETDVKPHSKKALVAAVKPCSYGGENSSIPPTDRVYSENPGHRANSGVGNDESCSPIKFSPRGISPSPRNDAVSRRRRERFSARQNRLKEGRGTAWVHLQTSGDIADPRTRRNLLDSVVATTSSSGSSSTDEEEENDEVLVIHNNSQLQRICREKRQKVKACGKEDILALPPRIRTSIVNRQGMYYRYGDQEKEAIACFDFLEEIPTSASERGPMELFQKRMICDPDSQQCNLESASKGQITAASRAASQSSAPSRSSQFSSFNSRLRLPGLWNKPLSHNMSSSTLNSQDCELLDHISLSDSCAESYSSTPDSFEDAS